MVVIKNPAKAAVRKHIKAVLSAMDSAEKAKQSTEITQKVISSLSPELCLSRFLNNICTLII